MSKARCVSPLAEGNKICGRDAVTTRRDEDYVFALCAEHAAEFDVDVPYGKYENKDVVEKRIR